MEQVLAQQGICFVLLHFSSQQETYLLPAIDLIRFYHQDKGQSQCHLDIFEKMDIGLSWGLSSNSLSRRYQRTFTRW